MATEKINLPQTYDQSTLDRMQQNLARANEELQRRLSQTQITVATLQKQMSVVYTQLGLK